MSISAGFTKINIVFLIGIVVLSAYFIFNTSHLPPTPPTFTASSNNTYLITKEGNLYYITDVSNKKFVIGKSTIELENLVSQSPSLEISYPKTTEEYVNNTSFQQCIQNNCISAGNKPGMMVNILKKL